MNISKKDIQAALQRIEEGGYKDPYGSDRAVETRDFEGLEREVEDLRLIVRYLTRQALAK